MLNVRFLGLRNKIGKNPDRVISIISLIITVIFSIWGLVLSINSTKLNAIMKRLAEEQITIAKQQSNAAVQISRFNELLDKESELITVSNSLLTKELETNRKIDSLLDVLVSQYNLNVEKYNRDGIKWVHERLNSYNRLATVLNDLNKETEIFRIARDKYRYVRLIDGKARLSFMNMIYDKSNILMDVGILIPNKKLEKIADSLLNSVYLYKSVCEKNLSMGVDVDTSYIGNKMFIDIMYHCLDFNDSVSIYFEEARGNTILNLNHLENIIELHSKSVGKRKKN